jgi:hypothetical protein
MDSTWYKRCDLIMLGLLWSVAITRSKPFNKEATMTLRDFGGSTVTLKDVYYALKFTTHIISLRKMLDNDWLVSHTEELVLVDAHLQSDPQLDMLENCKELLKLNDQDG